MSNTTVSESGRKCAHEQCKCQVATGGRFCSAYCKDAAGSKNLNSNAPVSTLRARWTNSMDDK